MPSFDETMENSRIFLTYSLAMTMLGKSAQILAERGADPKAMGFITTGIEMLSQQLRAYAEKKEIEEEIETELDRLCKTFDIKRA
jgi:hypothetical protein